MREVVAVTQITLDGVMQAPGGARGGPERRLRVRGWSFPHLDEVLQEASKRPSRSRWTCCSAVGRTRSSPPIGPTRRARSPIGSTAQGSTSPREHSKSLDWDNSTLLEGDVATAVGALKQRTVRSSSVRELRALQTLLLHGLVDEFPTWIAPVVLGRGKRLFGGDTATASSWSARTSRPAA